MFFNEFDEIDDKPNFKVSTKIYIIIVGLFFCGGWGALSVGWLIEYYFIGYNPELNGFNMMNASESLIQNWFALIIAVSVGFYIIGVLKRTLLQIKNYYIFK